MQDIKYGNQSKVAYSNCDDSSISANTEWETIISTRISKRFQSSSTKVGHNTRISSGRFTGADNGGEIKASNFTGVHGSRVVTTRSLCRPNGELLPTVELQERTVFSFNDINILPSDGYRGEWVMNPDTLIKDLNTWFMQQEVDTCCNQSAPSNCCDGGFPTAGHNILKVEANHQQVGDVGHNETSARSEKFSVIHGSILSCNVEVSYV